ncbi:hypothetical protein [Pseudoduganella chitinolytica]|uniref:Type IV pilus biogenesis protein PilP n=1 Tax=Pseudoduganella chitinolytica TaxID=34070 RepID=A0ABY8BIM0_9BURK|nr:hypothetical protein [Pseudoduganella chitinolytica]WEF34798.1 hypothetical protein PX653_08565 [Pseudoduganella chitinolytica]
MRALAAGLLMLAAATAAHAQTSYTTMGRLFTTPADRVLLDQQRSTAAVQGPAAAAAAPAPTAGTMPGMAPAGSAAAAPPAPPPAPVRFGGLLRRGDGQATIWVDDTPHETVLRARPGAGVQVDVGGRQVLLKPGQSWDPASGTVMEVPHGAPAR